MLRRLHRSQTAHAATAMLRTDRRTTRRALVSLLLSLIFSLPGGDLLDNCFRSDNTAALGLQPDHFHARRDPSKQGKALGRSTNRLTRTRGHDDILVGGSRRKCRQWTGLLGDTITNDTTGPSANQANLVRGQALAVTMFCDERKRYPGSEPFHAADEPASTGKTHSTHATGRCTHGTNRCRPDTNGSAGIGGDENFLAILDGPDGNHSIPFGKLDEHLSRAPYGHKL